MSLLRTVLRKNSSNAERTSPAPFNPGGPTRKPILSATSSAASIKSVASTIQSIASFYSTITQGGTKIPKRRRPDVSKLGAPQFYDSDPPPPEVIEGVEPLSQDELNDIAFTAAHATSLLDKNTKQPWLSLVLVSHAKPTQTFASYRSLNLIQGEVRVMLEKPDSIESIDVWLLVKAESVLDVHGGRLVNKHVNVWSSARGDPRLLSSGENLPSFKDKFPTGTFSFPFTFSDLPKDVRVFQKEEILRKGKGETRLDMPPSYYISVVGGFVGNITYMIGLDVKRGRFELGDELDVKFAYSPRARPIPQTVIPLPLLPTKEDWPISREVVGGWNLTSFGGRGRFRDEMTEIEGILSVQSPPVHYAGLDVTIPFTLTLHSTNSAAIQALADPSAIKVTFERSEVYGPDALAPRTIARKNRVVKLLSVGKIWKEAEFDEIIGNSNQEMESLASVHTQKSEDSTDILASEIEVDPKTEAQFLSLTPLRNASIVKLNKDTPTLETPPLFDSSIVQEQEAESLSPSPSLENLNDAIFPGQESTENVVTLRGEVPIGRAAGWPSFRYQYMSTEYLIKVAFSHKEYSHIKPTGPGLYSETPVWIVTDPPRMKEGNQAARADNSVVRTKDLTVVGEVVPLTSKSYIATNVEGEDTPRVRPTWRVARMSAA